jgi:hypothetical protein
LSEGREFGSKILYERMEIEENNEQLEVGEEGNGERDAADDIIISEQAN